MKEIPVLPVRDLVVFPRMMVPLFLSRDTGIDAVISLGQAAGRILVVTQKSPDTEEPRAGDCFPVGTICSVVRSVRLADGRLKVLVHGESRAKAGDWSAQHRARPTLLPEAPLAGEDQIEAEALSRSIIDNLDKVVQLGRNLSPDILMTFEGLAPEQIPDALGAQVGFPVPDAQRLLEAPSTLDRLRVAAELLSRESDILGVKAEIETQAKDELSRSQREFFLREQIRAIRTELGEGEDRPPDVAELAGKLEKAGLTEEARTEADKQLKRLEQMHPESAEATIIKTYLDWMVDLPWSKTTEDRVDIPAARRILDEDHYGLPKVKQRILEFLGVSKLKGSLRGPILCFVGPPGVGKTSLGKSIARAVGREFVRISLGGMKDEAEIRGHRRTYVGAMPGRILQGLKQAGVRNPVFMLDEIDKIGNDFRGDPASALLEVLDPQQNKEFSDHYLSVNFDLSDVLFIATANQLDTVPPALRDRMEVIEISGYSEEEKLRIAKQYLLPRQLEENGVSEANLQLTDSALRGLIEHYTRESGLRNLEREIASVCRKVALKVAEEKGERYRVSAGNLEKYLGVHKYEPLEESEGDEVGVATGLAWTPYGGEMLYVEAQFNPSKRGGISLTGQLGDVMKESVHAALSYVRTRTNFGIAADFFDKHELHLHVPEGAIPKDGPSAGITMAAAIVSAATGRPVRKRIAMTGEITLRGRVLPVGGVREKLLAANRMGINRVLVPKANVKDLGELPRSLRQAMEIIPVETTEQVLEEVLLPPVTGPGAASKPPARKRPSSRAKTPARAGWDQPRAKRSPASS
ncbi:MAG: endopeptidase La [Chrysiogenetes bacterium]|nr:endopeptidase La [Chrysiogenetes bacterium]